MKGGGNWTCETPYIVDRKEIIQRDEDVIWGGGLIGHFGHFMVECWSRLWYVVQNPDLKSKILFFVVGRKYQSWFNDFFQLMGIDKARIVYVDKPAQYRSVTVPDQAQYRIESFTKEYLIPYQAIKSNVTPGKIKKLYLTRTEDGVIGKQKRWDAHYFNDKYFEDFFVERGFKSVCLDKLSIEEQISLITGADEIAAVMGTLTNWVIFCKPSAKFIMLTRTHLAETFQCFLNGAFNFKNYYLVDVSKNFLYTKHADSMSLLGSTKYWTEFVADYFGEQIGEDDDSPYIGEASNACVDFWCRKYFDSELNNFDMLIDSIRNMCDRIITLDAKLSKDRPLLSYQTHLGGKGWSEYKTENVVSNELDPKFDIQAIRIDFPSCKVYYAVYWNDKEDWSEEVTNSEQAGTTGKSKPITGIKIRLDEAGAKDFDICYRVHKFDGEWTDWAKNGEELLSQGKKLNTLQIKLQNKLNRPSLSYQTHVAVKGWSAWTDENQRSNELDRQQDIQAIKIDFPSCKVYYAVYWNDKEGWSEEVTNSEQAGTTGKSKPITGIKIRLDEAGAKDFDICYRVHKFDGEWTDWAKNGEELLSQDVKLNALQIKLQSIR